MSPGTVASMAFSFWPPGMLSFVAGAGEGCAEGAEGVLGVVAGADGFGEAGGAGGLQAGEEDGGLDLGGGDGGGEVDGLERAAVDGDGAWPSTRSIFAPIWLSGLRMRSMGRRVREWSPMRVKVCGWGAMRPESMRMVEPELPQSSGAVGWRKAPAVPVTSMTAVRAVAGGGDGCAEGGHAGERGVRVGAGGEVGEARGAFGEAGEHGVAVGDGLVAGDGEGALQGAGGTDDPARAAVTS
jgi:hypothetical protein